MRKLRLIGSLVGSALVLGAWASPTLATTTAHRSVIGIHCPDETVWVDADALNGQKVQVTAFDQTHPGKDCYLIDSSGNVIFNPGGVAELGSPREVLVLELNYARVKEAGRAETHGCSWGSGDAPCNSCSFNTGRCHDGYTPEPRAPAEQPGPGDRLDRVWHLHGFGFMDE